MVLSRSFNFQVLQLYLYHTKKLCSSCFFTFVPFCLRVEYLATFTRIYVRNMCELINKLQYETDILISYQWYQCTNGIYQFISHSMKNVGVKLPHLKVHMEEC